MNTTKMTGSQRKVVRNDPVRRNHHDKWSRMTVGRMDPATGLMVKTTVTASTGKVHDEKLISRRGKDVS